MKIAKFILIISIIVIVGCQSDNQSHTKITVSAASSLTNSLIEIKKQFSEDYPHIKVVFNFDGSGTLRKQIEQGAPVDLFLIASHYDYEILNDKGLIEEAMPLLNNQLVIVQNEDYSFNTLDELIESDVTIAIATPEAVPVGTYAKQAFESLNVWDKLQSENRLIYGKNASHVKQLLNEGAVQAGVIYESDLLLADQLVRITSIDQQLHESIDYYITKVRNDKTSEAASLFYEYVVSEPSLNVFEKNGFLINDQARKLVEK
ncbi:molybdate ABC transporter substrate-binding protein [Bacillaceae bacterium W0354]